jgi:hypothetical protein
MAGQGHKRRAGSAMNRENAHGSTSALNKDMRRELPRLDLMLDNDPFAAEMCQQTKGFLSIRKM